MTTCKIKQFFKRSDKASLIDKEGVVGDKLISIQAPSLLTNELEDMLEEAIDYLPEISSPLIF